MTKLIERGLATNGHALAMAGQFMIFCGNVCTANEQIVEILIHSSIVNFQPRPQPNSEQKADEMHVSPAIAACPMKSCLLAAGF